MGAAVSKSLTAQTSVACARACTRTVGSAAALWVASAAVEAVDRVPLLPGLLQLVGLVTAATFYAR